MGLECSIVKHRFDEDKAATGGILGFDCQTLSNLNRNFFDLLFNLSAIVLCFFHLWTVIGEVAAVPILMLFAFLPFIRWQSRAQMKRFSLYFGARDARLGMSGESLSSLREIILSRMGQRFQHRLNELRETELAQSKAVARLSIATVLIYGGSTVALSVGSFLGYFLLHGDMPFVVVLNCLVTFEIIRTPLSHLSFNLSHLVNLSASARRAAQYVNDGLRKGTRPLQTRIGGEVEKEGLLTLAGFHAGEKDGAAPLISDLDFTLQPGEKVAVLGGPGAGKSLLLRMLAGVPAPHSGRISLRVHPADIVLLQPEVPLYSGSLQGNLCMAPGSTRPTWLTQVFDLFTPNNAFESLANDVRH